MSSRPGRETAGAGGARRSREPPEQELQRRREQKRRRHDAQQLQQLKHLESFRRPRAARLLGPGLPAAGRCGGRQAGSSEPPRAGRGRARREPGAGDFKSVLPVGS
ncbi:hypothetical protein P7K49_024860 [Saguinus oedipus]|uniref:Uncharacterized protein n=1 Tax=Saguinus oedipus TaxID=9490 RepID=A0ABQ9UG05_SAGOE|nr:hypothetical protein P7K49_024860 [Saguinus oedipus]